jgi:formylmethanofuran dehydrogenase subunit E
MAQKKSKNIPKELKGAIQFHGHFCPGLTIGYRAAKIALRELGGKRAKDEEMVCIIHTDGCGVDGIQFLTGCTLGKGNLIFQDYGKQTFIFLLRKKTGRNRGVRISFDPDEKVSHAFGPARHKRGAKATKTKGSVGSKEEAALRLLHLPERTLYSLTPLKNFPIPEKARIFSSERCASCGELTMEPRLRLQDGKPVCLECCGKEYTRGW